MSGSAKEILEDLFDDEDLEIPSMAKSMLNHGFPRFMDAMLSNMVWDNRDKIHNIVDAIIAQRKRVEGKGRLKKSVVGRTSAPEYTLRNPKVTPTSAQFRHSSFTAQPTRSDVEDILERRNCTSTYGRQWEEARQSCMEAVQRIIDEGRTRNLKFFDESFYYDKRDNLYPDGAPADCSVAEPKFCARLQEMFPSARLVMDELTPDDITQGEVGDCFLIGAVSALASSDPEHIRDLFIHHDVTVGVYGMVFYKCGGWEWVIVDDIVPYVKERSGGRYPLYASSTGENIELWPIILEKAYAKMHYNWSTVDGGWAKEALVDMSGGIATTLNFTTSDAEMSFDRFHRLVESPHTILACAVPENVQEEKGGSAGRAGEASALFGLFKGHQYAVIDTQKTSDGMGFVKCRNPWGNEAEWKGPYSDGSVEWTRNPKHKRELKPVFADDGEFWMKFSDFKKYLGIVDVVTTYPDDYNVITMFGQGSMDLIPENTYVMQVCEKPADLAITLAQDDPKIKYGKEEDHEAQFSTYASLKFTVYKMKEIPSSHDNIREHMAGKIASDVVREREVCLSQRFEPGAYIVYPTVQLPTPKPGAQPDDVGIFFRIIGPPGSNFSLHRPYDKHRKDLNQVIGKCPQIDEAMGRGPEILSLLSRSIASPLKAVGDFVRSGMGGGSAGTAVGRNKAAAPSLASTLHWENASAVFGEAVVAAAQHAAVSIEETERLAKDLQDSKDYVTQLEALLKRQQEQIDSLNAKLAAAARPSTAPPASPPSSSAAQAPSSPPVTGVKVSNAFVDPSPRKKPFTTASAIGEGAAYAGASPLLANVDTAWDRLKMTKNRLEELINIVFIELGGGDNLTVEDAVNGVRLLVTTGTGLDDIAYAHKVALNASGAAIDVAAFAKMCNDSILAWEALGPTTAVAK